ncbi:MAG: SDR family oxidoreductase [Gammaproteobacteria bacterium]|nr:SDR family oxidoreductase [Gammaproteobacteria bacterium]
MKMLVVGARGLVGQGVLEAMDDADCELIAVSRRAPDFATRADFVSVDLTDRDACRAAFSGLSGVTHVVYAALHERPELIAGWRDEQQIATNLAMLENVLDFVEPSEHLTLLQGTKAYGAHLHPMRNPGKEHHPRHAGPNFYWVQEDLVRERAARCGWAFTIMRPQIVCGVAVGSPMNMTMAIGVYAAIQRERGGPLSFPGGEEFITEATDAVLLGGAIRWAASAEESRDETFNVTNGDQLVWRSAWQTVADAFGMEVGGDQPTSLVETMPRHAELWDAMTRKYGLAGYGMDALVGSSWQFADAVFGLHGGQHTLLSTVKIRQAGFGDCIDTEVMLDGQLRRLQDLRILPS